ncbi:unnamed protein product [Ectocarpus sp. 4 AP-2014]
MAGALSVLAVATAAVTRERRRASRVARAKSIVRRGVQVLLAVDIGSSSVRCSAYTVGSPPVLVPGCAVQLKHAIVKEDGTADAEQVILLVDDAVDKCFGELRAREVAHAVIAVGFACFGMNLVGVDASGKPCTPVFTYAGSSGASCGPSPSPPPPAGGGSSKDSPPGDCSGEEDVVKRLRKSLERMGRGGKGGLEEARRRTGAPTHVSYAPAQLLRWLQETTTAGTVATPTRERVKKGDSNQRRWRSPQRSQVKLWQTLPSLIAARWCCLWSAPVSYSEASWTGMLDLRKLEWDTPTLSVLREAGFDCSALPRLADIGDLRAGASGATLKRWPELDGASIRLGLGDGAAACLGSGCDEKSRKIAVTIGTSAAARVVLRMEGKEPALAAARVTAGASTDGVDETVPADDALCHVPRGLWCYRVDRHRAVLGGALTDGGSVFEWLRSTLALAPGEDMAGVMEKAERMPPASHGLTILPFFSGERSPGYNDDATACIFGLRRSTTRPQLVRAGLESVCLRLAAIIDLMKDLTDGGSMKGSSSNEHEPQASSTGALVRDHEEAEVVTSGNAFAASPFWRKMLADSLGRTVRASGATEETSLGVAVILSSLESEALRQVSAVPGSLLAAGLAASGEARSSSRENRTAPAVTAVHTPDNASFRAYREAGLAQQRAYRAVFGDVAGDPHLPFKPTGTTID